MASKCCVLLIAAAFCRGTASAAETSSTTPEWPLQTFLTAPQLAPPEVRVDVMGPTAPGHIFVALSNTGLIMAENGDLLWSSIPANTSAIKTLTPATWGDQPVLVAYRAEANLPPGLGLSYGYIDILDDTYTSIQNVTLTDPTLVIQQGVQSVSKVDTHEAFLTRDNTILVSAYNITPWDLSSVGGPKNGWLRDSLMYELELETSRVLHLWRASDHIPITASRAPFAATPGYGNVSTSAWDFFHINSADTVPGGYVISGRHTWQALYVDKASNTVKWALQGQDGGDFSIDDAVTFHWQHDIRYHQIHNETYLTIHDNENNYTAPYKPSKALLVKLDFEKMTATNAGVYIDPNGQNVSANSGGSVQFAGDAHNVFVGRGGQAVNEEYMHNGTLVMTWRFGPSNTPIGPAGSSYRAFKSVWKGYPKTKPTVKACTASKGGVNVHMSWNGATEVTDWLIYGGNSTSKLDLLLTVKKNGFETSALVQTHKFFQVEAAGPAGDSRFCKTASSVVDVEAAC